jgi:hypothetical protein
MFDCSGQQIVIFTTIWWYCVEISNRFAALENSDSEVDINRAWKAIRENIKISAKESLSYYELKKHNP